MTTSTATMPPSLRECEELICTPGSLFELETVEIGGRPTRVWKNLPKSYRSFLLDRMATHADVRQALGVAAWLVARGVRQGTKVGLAGYNCAGWVVSWVAIHLLGAVPVMVNAATVPESMVHCLKLTRPPVVLTDATTAATLSFQREALAAGGVGEVVSWQNTDHVKTNGRIPVIDFRNLGMPAESTRAVLEGKGFGIEDQTPESDGVVYFTSGTTGYPKAVLSTQRAALHPVISGPYGGIRTGVRAGLTVKQALEMAEAPPPQPPVMLMAVPFFHVTGGSILMMSFSNGVPMVLMRRWNVDEAVTLLAKYKVTSIVGVPAIVIAVMQNPKLPKDFVLQSTGYGGAPAPDRMPADIKSRWPDASLSTAWGMTESNATHTVVSGQDYLQRPKSCGSVCPISEVRIVDQETKALVPTGSAGLIQIRGANLMKAYYNDPEATRKAIDKDGWLDTGDAGYMDDEGFLYICDRIKDIIIRGGENISSEEVENAIYLDDRVGEAAAVPVPHDVLGEEVAVAVSLRPGAQATAEEIIEAAYKRLRSHARPVFVWVSPELLPRNANGKIIKTELKQTVQRLYAESKSLRAKL